MYEVSAAINDVQVIRVNLTTDFQLNFQAIQEQSTSVSVMGEAASKLLFICSPNNPTGNSMKGIEEIIQDFDGIVFVDEAYIDFSSEESFISRTNKYPNLIVSQTFSKAWGLAAARVGVAYASKEIISLFNKVKPPYNVSGLNQMAALSALENQEEFESRKAIVLQEKALLEKHLSELSVVKKVYASDANFLLIEMTDADKIYQDLVKQKVITRNRNSVVKNCIRITVGSPLENQKLLTAIKNIQA
jgi:histidinol-phosphate aminotransferase